MAKVIRMTVVIWEENIQSRHYFFPRAFDLVRETKYPTPSWLDNKNPGCISISRLSRIWGKGRCTTRGIKSDQRTAISDKTFCKSFCETRAVTIQMCGCLISDLMPAAVGFLLIFRSRLTIFSLFPFVKSCDVGWFSFFCTKCSRMIDNFNVLVCANEASVFTKRDRENQINLSAKNLTRGHESEGGLIEQICCRNRVKSSIWTFTQADWYIEWAMLNSAFKSNSGVLFC